MSVNPFATVALIQRNGRFLAVSRKEDHQDLGFPGGKLEQGETAEHAVLRELREETGLRAALSDLRPAYSGVDDLGHLCMSFVVDLDDGEPMALEGSWVGWVPPARLLERTCSFAAYNRKVFDHLGLTGSTDAPT